MFLGYLRVAACASPGTRRRRSAAHALWPSGFLKVDPPVFERSGCDASRAAAMRSISACIAAGSLRDGRETSPRRRSRPRAMSLWR